MNPPRYMVTYYHPTDAPSFSGHNDVIEATVAATVAVHDRRDGIDAAHVFQIQPDGLMELVATVAPETV